MKPLVRIICFISLCVCTHTRLLAQPPILNSYPAASSVIYLDFDGEYVSGTGWNWSGDINAEAATVSAEGIVETFNRVAEDYRPFMVNVTTDFNVYQSAPANQRIRVILTPTYSWYGYVGGVAFVGSFSWGDDTPCWVFSSLLGNDPKFLAEAVSHEAGHTLGLQHQSEYDSACTKILEYSEGKGDGEIGWAPIMGVGYYKNHTTWNIGPNAVGCSKIQNDIAILAGRLGLRADDHANMADSATAVPLQGTTFTVSGLINQSTDTDLFRFDMPLTGHLFLNAIPENVGSGNQGANIDISISILNSTLDTIGKYNPSALLDAGIDTNLQMGSYYFAVNGVGNINHSEYGSIGYYSLQGSLAYLLPLKKFVLQGYNTNGYHQLDWTYQADKKISAISIEYSADGRNFNQLVSLEGNAKRFMYKPLRNKNYYRIKAVMEAGEQAYYSNIISLEGTGAERGKLHGRFVNDRVIIDCTLPLDYFLYDAGGNLVSKGSLRAGTSQVPVPHAPAGVLFLRLDDGTRTLTEKLIKQ